MKYEIGEHFELAYDPDFKTISFTWLMPNLNDLQQEYQELFESRELDELLDDILHGWKDREFLEYLYDKVTDKFFDEIMEQEKTKGTIKDIKFVEEGDRQRLMCWWTPPQWFVGALKQNNEDLDMMIVKENIIEAIGDRL